MPGQVVRQQFNALSHGHLGSWNVADLDQEIGEASLQDPIVGLEGNGFLVLLAGMLQGGPSLFWQKLLETLPDRGVTPLVIALRGEGRFLPTKHQTAGRTGLMPTRSRESL